VPSWSPLALNAQKTLPQNLVELRLANAFCDFYESHNALVFNWRVVCADPPMLQASAGEQWDTSSAEVSTKVEPVATSWEHAVV
jgi:hypothetical protein